MAQDKNELDKQNKNLEANKVADDAQKSLTDNNEKSAQKAGGKSTEQKSKKEKQVKDMTSYQEQALQGATKSKGNKKVLIIVLLLIGLAVVAGVAIALFFVFRPEEEPSKAIVCKVEVFSYYVDLESEPERYVVIGDGDEFNFDENTQSTSSYTKDLEMTMTDARDVSMMYLVNNVTENKYTYTFDFTGIIMSNCDMIVKINNGSYTIDDSKRIVSVTLLGDVVLEIRISVKDDTIQDPTSTFCEGNIDLSLSLE